MLKEGNVLFEASSLCQFLLVLKDPHSVLALMRVVLWEKLRISLGRGEKRGVLGTLSTLPFFHFSLRTMLFYSLKERPRNKQSWESCLVYNSTLTASSDRRGEQDWIRVYRSERGQDPREVTVLRVSVPSLWAAFFTPSLLVTLLLQDPPKCPFFLSSSYLSRKHIAPSSLFNPILTFITLY